MASGLSTKATWVGRTIGSGWTVDSVIGVGGSATVFRATKLDGASAAIKVMHHQLALAWTKRFEREARLLQALSHSAIPQLYEFGRLSGVPFLVLELLTGHSLDVLSRATHPLGVSRIITYAADALAALEVVHTRGIVHRDLKPSNLFLTEAGVLKVLDFGAAVDVDATSLGPDSLTSGLLGTPAYMPPEQARGRWDMVDHRSDLWSLGAVIFTLLSGEHVHPAQTSNEQLSFAMTRTARSLGRVVPGLNAALVRVVDRALAYERRERFESAADFRAALLASLNNASFATRDDSCVTVREFRSSPDHSGAIDVPNEGRSNLLRRAGWVGGLGACVLVAAVLRAKPATIPNSSPAPTLSLLTESEVLPAASSPISPTALPIVTATARVVQSAQRRDQARVPPAQMRRQLPSARTVSRTPTFAANSNEPVSSDSDFEVITQPEARSAVTRLAGAEAAGAGADGAEVAARAQAAATQVVATQIAATHSAAANSALDRRRRAGDDDESAPSARAAESTTSPLDIRR